MLNRYNLQSQDEISIDEFHEVWNQEFGRSGLPMGRVKFFKKSVKLTDFSLDRVFVPCWGNSDMSKIVDIPTDDSRIFKLTEILENEYLLKFKLSDIYNHDYIKRIIVEYESSTDLTIIKDGCHRLLYDIYSGVEYLVYVIQYEQHNSINIDAIKANQRL